MNRTLLISILKKVFLISGVALIAFALTIKWIIPYYFTTGFGLNQIIVIVTGIFLITVSFLISGTIKSKIIENTAILFFSYLFFEIIVSLLYVTDVLEPQESIWAFEDSGKTIHFDPIRGYYLTQIPSRFTRITKGTVEYIGVLKGNNEGFPDQDNFYPKRDSQIAKRFAVFGDSFSAAQYIEKNWPDSVEKIARGRNIPIQLLNFSVD